jgi:HlyD family secretion protein
MKRQTKITWAMATAIVMIGLLLAFRPKPTSVETAVVNRGSVRQTLDEEGRTRMHDRFILASTVAGKLRRIQLHAGDHVRAGEVIAWIDPAPIEPRQTAVLQARLEAARAAQNEVDALVGHAQAERDQAASDLDRSRKLFAQGVSSKESLERATSFAMATAKQLEAAQSRAQTAGHQVEEATAALMVEPNHLQAVPIAINAPVDGRILRLLEQSERVLPPGAPIVEIGYTPKLEIVADFLTADAVSIYSGMDAIIDDWGGEKPLRARVRTVEPGAFTKISALGVEEQRVNVILDFMEGSANLADAYRVEVRVITWEGSNVLRIPASAIFRTGAEWAVFRVSNGLAHRTRVQAGHRGNNDMEIVDGLNVGDLVIVHPSPDLKDGARVTVGQQTEELD